VFLVSEVHDDFLETVVWSTLELDGLVGGFIADIANMSCSELEEL
jgi:hypothetical protein